MTKANELGLTKLTREKCNVVVQGVICKGAISSYERLECILLIVGPFLWKSLS